MICPKCGKEMMQKTNFAKGGAAVGTAMAIPFAGKGALVGAKLGTSVAPGIGSVIGGAVGALTGLGLSLFSGAAKGYAVGKVADIVIHHYYCPNCGHEE